MNYLLGVYLRRMSTFIVDTFLIIGSQLARHRRVDHLASRRLRLRRPFPHPRKRRRTLKDYLCGIEMVREVDEASFIFLQSSASRFNLNHESIG
jgi:hypothetical protein